jgi:hypothetical protein
MAIEEKELTRLHLPSKPSLSLWVAQVLLLEKLAAASDGTQQQQMIRQTLQTPFFPDLPTILLKDLTSLSFSLSCFPTEKRRQNELMMQMQIERAKHKTTADGPKKKKKTGKKLTVAKPK